MSTRGRAIQLGLLAVVGVLVIVGLCRSVLGFSDALPRLFGTSFLPLVAARDLGLIGLDLSGRARSLRLALRLMMPRASIPASSM